MKHWQSNLLWDTTKGQRVKGSKGYNQDGTRVFSSEESGLIEWWRTQTRHHSVKTTAKVHNSGGESSKATIWLQNCFSSKCFCCLLLLGKLANSNILLLVTIKRKLFVFRRVFFALATLILQTLDGVIGKLWRERYRITTKPLQSPAFFFFFFFYSFSCLWTLKHLCGL